jgi:sulfur carrier protein ThiS
VIILNNRTIPRSDFDQIEIKDNDRIFFIVPLSGG